LSEDDFLELGKACEGYSGSDITVVVKEAMMMPVRRCQTATRFKMLPDGFWIPTPPSDPEGKNMTLFDVEPSKLRAPEVKFEDFMNALSRIKPSVALADLERQIEFTNSFGQDG